MLTITLFSSEISWFIFSITFHFFFLIFANRNKYTEKQWKKLLHLQKILNTFSNLPINQNERNKLFFTVAFNLHRAVLDCCLCLRDLCNLVGVGASAGASVEVPSYGESYGVIRVALMNIQLRFLARAFRLFAAEKFHVTSHYTVKKALWYARPQPRYYFPNFLLGGDNDVIYKLLPHTESFPI
jgi:hypothetical protein